MENKKISIIIPMRNEEDYIAHCIDSIIASDYEDEDMEIIIINSMSEDNSKNIVKKYMSKYKNITSYSNSNIFTPFAFNIGINYATGEYIFIVSAHCEYDKDYFSVLVKYAEELKADAVGAVSRTGVLSNSRKAHSIKKVLSHKFGVGNSYFRVGTDSIIEVDAISGCYNKSVFKKYGLYNEKLIRNQDIELNKRIKNGGGKLYLIPYTQYTYFVRENFRDLSKNNYNNGLWNILTVYHTRTFESLSIRHFIPLAFVLSLVLPVIGSLFYAPLIWIAIFSSIGYLSLVIIISFKLQNKSNSFFYLIPSFITLHISYGVGSLVGILSLLRKTIKGLK